MLVAALAIPIVRTVSPCIAPSIKLSPSKKIADRVCVWHLVSTCQSEELLKAATIDYLVFRLLVTEIIILPQHHHFEHHYHVLLFGSGFALRAMIHHRRFQPAAEHLKVYHAV